MKKKILWVCLGALLLGLILAFIFGNSLQSVERSRSLSTMVRLGIQRVLPGATTGDPVRDGRILRKTMHVIEYCILGAVLALIAGKLRLKKWIPLCAGAVLGAADEWIQGLHPGRSPRLTDWALDLLGICLGTGLILLIGYIKKKRSRN